MDRKSSYSTNPGSVGMLFESRVVSSTDIHRNYGVFSVRLDDLCVCMTGEVDGVNQKTGFALYLKSLRNPIEIKTRPQSARQDPKREFDTFLQSHLASVESIMTAGFTPVGRGKDGPVQFLPGHSTHARPRYGNCQTNIKSPSRK
jgi:hypothetical protein